MLGKCCRWGNPFLNKVILYSIAGVFIFFATTIAGSAEKSPLYIQYQNSLLSVNIQGARLSDVVRELIKKTGVVFNYKFIPNQVVYARFKDLPLKKGIKQTIPYGTIFVSGQNSLGKETVKSVFILTSLSLPQNQKQNVPLTSPSQPLENSNPKTGIGHLAWQAKGAAEAYRWLLQLQDEDPEKRVEAITQLGELRSNIFSVKGLYFALEDKDNRVRQAASEGLKILDERNVFNSLREELQQNETIIQQHALNVLSLQEGPKWIALLRQAIDSNQIAPSLIKTAKGILIYLQTKSRKN